MAGEQVLETAGLVGLAGAVGCALGAVRAFVALEIPAVLDDLSGRARQRGVAAALAGAQARGHVPRMGAASLVELCEPRGGRASVRDPAPAVCGGSSEDVVATALGMGVEDLVTSERCADGGCAALGRLDAGEGETVVRQDGHAGQAEAMARDWALRACLWEAEDADRTVCRTALLEAE